MATVIRPDDTVPKWRIIELENKKFAVQKKILFWWVFQKVYISCDFADWRYDVMEFDKESEAAQFIRENLKIKTEKYKVIKKFNSEGISV